MDFEELKEYVLDCGYSLEQKSDGIYAYNKDSDNLFSISIEAKKGCDMKIVFNSQVTSVGFIGLCCLNSCMSNTERAARAILNYPQGK